MVNTFDFLTIYADRSITYIPRFGFMELDSQHFGDIKALSYDYSSIIIDVSDDEDLE